MGVRPPEKRLPLSRLTDPHLTSPASGGRTTLDVRNRVGDQLLLNEAERIRL